MAPPNAGARVRPLRLRDGVRYACAGDGVCCSDVHLLGPVSRGEVKRLSILAPDSVEKNVALDAVVLKTRQGRCVHLSAAGCELHARHGPEAKPLSCRRFPLRLIGTPDGGRVATEHRCPCRTMGQRPLLRLEDVEAQLTDAHGRLQADARVGNRLRLAPRRFVPFSTYVRTEAEWMARLAAGDDPAVVLAAEPYPKLADGVTWTDVAHLLRSHLDGSACSEALAWFGDMVLADHDAPLRSLRSRPWSWAFDRAEARSSSPATGGLMDVLGDFAADAWWSLDWVERGSLAAGRAELVTRLHVGRRIVERLVEIGVRLDRAQAEAVLVLELVGAASLWRSVVASIDRRIP